MGGLVKAVEPDVKINRDAPVRLLPFTDFFQGFEKVEAVRRLFGEKTEEVLNKLRVEFFSSRYGYMGVNDEDGHLLVSTYHLKKSDFRVLYLDVIHELHHVKQYFDGRQLFSADFEYVDNPVEVEAYKATVQEAKRIGMSDDEIVEYLKVEWVSPEEHERLLESVGLKKSS